jgi:hypothetical protein
MPSLRLKPSEGPVGTDVTAIGAGFRPNVSYRIQVEDEWLKPGTTNNRGGFITQFKLPPMPYGNQDITSVSQAAHQLAHARFRVAPQITQVEPEEISLGDMITVSGTGFGSAELILVHVDDRPVNLEEETPANPDGTFVVRFIATDDLVPPTPVVITVTGKETQASAQIQRAIKVTVAL